LLGMVAKASMADSVDMAEAGMGAAAIVKIGKRPAPRLTQSSLR
jgi:hypothetical protein